MSEKIGWLGDMRVEELNAAVNESCGFRPGTLYLFPYIHPLEKKIRPDFMATDQLMDELKSYATRVGKTVKDGRVSNE